MDRVEYNEYSMGRRIIYSTVLCSTDTCKLEHEVHVLDCVHDVRLTGMPFHQKSNSDSVCTNAIVFFSKNAVTLYITLKASPYPRS